MASTLTVKRKEVEDDSTTTTLQKKQRLDTHAELTLLQSLDFSTLNDTSTINERFDLIARSLLHDFHLVIKRGLVETIFEILEIEFYLRKDGCHEDPFTHGSEEQKVYGNWYFHRVPRRSTDSTRNLTSLTAYRGGSRKGIDLTIGDSDSLPPLVIPSPYFDSQTSSTTLNQESKTRGRGGVLLRTLRRVSDNSLKVISGPSLLVDEILRCSDTTDISTLVHEKWGGDTSAFRSSSSSSSGSGSTSLFLRAKKTSSSSSSSHPNPTPIIYRSPRIGLDLSHPGTTASASHPRVTYLPKLYRYFILPNLLTSKGRPQTFLGVLLLSCPSSLDPDPTLTLSQAGHILDSELLLELVRITGLGKKTVFRYLEWYKDGVGFGKLEDFVGVHGKGKGKGASSSPGTYLQMMGTLARYHRGYVTSESNPMIS